MPTDAATPARIVDEAGLLLRTIRDEIAEGRKPYASDIRRLVERSLSLRYAEFVQFLERYGFLSLERRTDLLALTKAGLEAAEGQRDRLRSLEGDAVHHFGERLAAVAALPAQVRGVRFDKRYLRYECIGAGGMGTVWRGRLLSIDRPVAIKVLHGIFEFYTAEQRDEILRRLELAVRDHARLVNPFVLQCLDQDVASATPYYVMELATGGDLRKLLDGGPLPPAVAVRYFVQIALGLRAAHAEGLLHRDLKPENVLLDGAGNVKLSDFGITRVLERDGGAFRQAYVGFGSVGYMAPELFRPGVEVTAAADIYSLGILLYEMLVGGLPGRRSPMPSALVSGLPVEIDELFDRMTQDDPAGRPADLDAVLTALWTSRAVVDLLDARQAPFFVESPVALPGLRAHEATGAPDAAPPPVAAEAPRPRAEAAPRLEAKARPEPRTAEAAPERKGGAAPAAEMASPPAADAARAAAEGPPTPPATPPATDAPPAADARPAEGRPGRTEAASPAPEPARAEAAPEPARAEAAPEPARAEAAPEPARRTEAAPSAPEPPRQAEAAPEPASRPPQPAPRAPEPPRQAEAAPEPASRPPQPAPRALELPAVARPVEPSSAPRAEAPPLARPVDSAALLPEAPAVPRAVELPFDADEEEVDEDDEESAELLDDSLIDDPDPALFASHEADGGMPTGAAPDEDSLEVVDVEDLEVDEEGGGGEEKFQTAVVDTRGRPRDPEARRRLDERLKRLKKPAK